MSRDHDEDLSCLLGITKDFLRMYFGHSEASAQATVDRFLDRHGDLLDDYFFFHESSYRVAAIIHFVEDLHGSFDGFSAWIADSPHCNPPQAAADHFNRKFWQRSTGGK